MISCDGGVADQRDCYHTLMASQCVSTGYVRMASFLYTKVWRVKEFVGKSERILLTPDFAVSIVGLTLFFFPIYVGLYYLTVVFLGSKLRVLEPRDSNYIIGTKYGKVLKNIPFTSLATVCFLV